MRNIATVLQKIQDYASFVKLKLSLLVLFSGVVGFLMASGSKINPPVLTAFVFGSFFVIGGANAFNEIFEQKEDALMNRTCMRPFPQKRISLVEAYVLATSITLLGVFVLSFWVNLLVPLLAVLAFLLYVFAYTPAKKLGPWCTVIGAIPGAIPAMMGPAAVEKSITPLGWLLFSIVFLWQFPHFFAIAWLVREDYQKAGFRIFPVASNERLVAYEILFCSSALVAISPLVSLMNQAGTSYFFGSLFLSLLLFAYAIRFWFRLSKPMAGKLMRMALAYLPFLFLLMLLDRVNRPG